jgi:hypothetical protein
MDKENMNCNNLYESSSFPCGGILCRIDVGDCSRDSSLDPTNNNFVGKLQDQSAFSKTQWKNRYKKQPTCFNCQQKSSNGTPPICAPHHPTLMSSTSSINETHEISAQQPQNLVKNSELHHEISVPAESEATIFSDAKSNVHVNNVIGVHQTKSNECSVKTQVPNTENDPNQIDVDVRGNKSLESMSTTIIVVSDDFFTITCNMIHSPHFISHDF